MGMVIEYCTGCRKRIEAQELKDGSACALEGASYCALCSKEVGAVDPIPGNDSGSSAPRRRPRGLRGSRGTDRIRRADNSGNTQLIMAAVGGVALLVLAVVAMWPTDSPRPRRHKKPTVESTTATPNSPAPSSTPSAHFTPATPATPATSMKTQIKLERSLKQLGEALDDATAFASKNSEPEMWSNVDAQWQELLDDTEWTVTHVARDPQAMALRAKAEQGRTMSRDRFEVAGRQEIDRALKRAQALIDRNRAYDALRELGKVRAIFHELTEYEEVVSLKQAIEAKLKAESVVSGEWVNVTHANWMLPKSQQDEKTHDNEFDCTLLRVGGKGAMVLFTPQESQRWKDYEIEAEVRVDLPQSGRNQVQLGMRITPGPGGRPQGMGFTFAPGSYTGKWLKVHLAVRGETFTVTVDGQHVTSAPTKQHTHGTPMLLLSGEGTEFRVRSARFKKN